MGSYKIEMLQTACTDIIELYFCEENPNTALRITDRIIDKIDLLVSNPLIGKISPDSELAKLEYRILKIEGCIVFYKIIHDSVVVYSVLRENEYYHASLK